MMGKNYIDYFAEIINKKNIQIIVQYYQSIALVILDFILHKIMY